MPEIQIIEDEIAGNRWYSASASFATAAQAKWVVDQIARRAKRGNLGFYRHGPSDDPGRTITVVSLDRPSVVSARRFLRTGTNTDLSERDRYMLIGRRARVVIDMAQRGQHSGRLVWRRPDDRGATLDPKTLDMIEPPPPEG